MDRTFARLYPHVTRNTRAALEAAGFDTSGVRDEGVDSEPKIYAPHIAGRATVRRTSSVEVAPS